MLSMAMTSHVLECDSCLEGAKATWQLPYNIRIPNWNEYACPFGRKLLVQHTENNIRWSMVHDSLVGD